MTTKDILKILPFEEKFKNDLLLKYDGLSDDQRFTLEQILWDTYFALYELKLDENLQVALAEAKNGKEKLDKDLYKRVEDKTDLDMQQLAGQNIAEKDLEATRIAMQKIVQEMKLANSPAKPN